MSTERYETDSPEDIRKCLNCTKKECDNCLSAVSAIRQKHNAINDEARRIARRKRYAQEYARNKEHIKERSKISSIKKYLRGKGL